MRPSDRRYILPDFTHHLLSLEGKTKKRKDELFVVVGTGERTLCVVPEKLHVVFSYGKQTVSSTFSC
jgi:hypothetical protein